MLGYGKQMFQLTEQTFGWCSEEIQMRQIFEDNFGSKRNQENSINFTGDTNNIYYYISFLQLYKVPEIFWNFRVGECSL